MYGEQVSSRYPRDVYAGRESGVAQFFTGVYGWMASGVAISGAVALFMLSQPKLLFSMMQNPILMMGMLLAQVGISMFFSARASSISGFAAANLFFAYAGLMGVLLAPLPYIYTGASIGQAFFSAAGAFGGLAIYGATTKRDLSVMTQMLTMGLVGGMVALVVNIFLRSPAIDWIANCALLLVFMGMTAWHNQELRRVYARSGTAGNMAIVGAFSLYVLFINLFLTILRLFGDRRDDR